MMESTGSLRGGSVGGRLRGVGRRKEFLEYSNRLKTFLNLEVVRVMLLLPRSPDFLGYFGNLV